MLMLALRLILKDKGDKQHYLPFVGSSLGVKIFLKKRVHMKEVAYRGLKYLFTLYIGVWRKFNAKIVYFFFSNKKNSQSYVFFYSLIIEFL